MAFRRLSVCGAATGFLRCASSPALAAFAGVERDGATHQLRVLSAAGEAFELLEDGRRRGAFLSCAGSQLWARIGGRTWDFEDISFEPTVRAAAENDGKVRASMNGRVVSLDIAVGDRVSRGQKLLVLEAMKMEHVHVAPGDGTVEAIDVAEGDQVDAHRIVIEVTLAGAKF